MVSFHRDALLATLAALCWVEPALADDPQTCIRSHEEGLAAEERGALRVARQNYGRCADTPCPEVIRDECVERRAAVEQAIPTVVVGGVTASGQDVTQGRYRIDGIDVEHQLNGRPIAVDPGRHEVVVTSPNGVGRTKILVRQGEKDRVVTVTVLREDGDDMLIHPAAWISGSLGLAGLGIFAIFGGLGLAQEGVVDECRPNCTRADVDRMRDLYLVGDIGLLTGLVGLAGAGILGIALAPDTKVEATGAGLRLHMRF